MSRPRPYPLLSLVVCSLVAFGCGGDPSTSDTGTDASGGSTEAGETEPMGSMASTRSTGTVSTDTDPSATTDALTSGANFAAPPDGGGGITFECDIWEDDCPDGEKCMPWANDGGNSWNATKCSPVQPSPDGVGDPCTVEGGGTSGVDSCGDRAMCYYVDSETDMGVCVAFCGGSELTPVCDDPDNICTIANDGVLTLCRPSCDPILQDCDGDAVCMEAPGGNVGFTCMVDISDGEMAGDPCEYNNSCPPGLTCEGADGVPGCVSAKCCTPWCDLTEPNPDAACLLSGQECDAVFAAGDAPPGLDHVGICFIPT